MNNNPKPIDVLRDGALKASLWYHAGEKNGPFITVSLAKTYRDAAGHLADSHSFVGTELLRLSRLMGRAYDRSGDLLREFRASPEQRDLLDHSDTAAADRLDGNHTQAGRDFDRGSRRQDQRAATPR